MKKKENLGNECDHEGCETCQITKLNKFKNSVTGKGLSVDEQEKLRKFVCERKGCIGQCCSDDCLVDELQKGVAR